MNYLEFPLLLRDRTPKVVSRKQVLVPFCTGGRGWCEMEPADLG